MTDDRIKVLLIEDSDAAARLVEKQLTQSDANRYEIVKAGRMAEAAERMGKRRPDIVLLDLTLPDCQGLESVSRACGMFRGVPIVVLTCHDDQALAVEAVRHGAQEFLVKGETSVGALGRAVRCAIERQRATENLRMQCLIDDLTCLYNRRGFLAFAEQQRLLASRTKVGFLLFFADVNGMKHTNDTHGHAAGDRALAEAARALRATFRRSDVLGRIGGDEFAVLAVGAAENSSGALEARLRRALALRNSSGKLVEPVTLSIGNTWFDPGQPRELEELMAEADRQMYARKSTRGSN